MVKIGVIGAGKFGTNLLNTFSQIEREGRCKLVAICDINKQTLEVQSKRYNVRGYTDYKEMLNREEIDGVAVATPDPFHKEPVIYAAGQGKHIFVEKPMDVTVEGCLEMIDVCRKNNVFLQVDFHKRFDPFHMQVRRDVQEGLAGTIEYGYAHMEDKIVVPRDWFPGWAPKSSPVWFLGVHMFDLIRWIIGSNGKSVYARGSKSKLKSLGIDTYDAISTMVEFESGAVVTFDLSWILPEDFEAIVNQGFRLVGENGAIECDSQDRGTRVFYQGKGVATYNPVFISETDDRRIGRTRYSGYGIESIADFVYNLEFLSKGGCIDELKGGITGLGEDGLEVTKIAVAIHRSLESGKIEQVK
ncbi:MAG: Gfo/Idh/MocA family oxidoreductase [Candidatus Ratteibacteria bacterium]|nr:Gfo/Idh/MocA family oxidoreductase [Candidatus Ratteibacteria bacterium]